MVSRIATVAFRGIEAVSVDVQIMLSSGKMGFSIVGLADKAVAESRERVQAALHAIGVELPAKKIIINLAPADLPKEGSHYDLPIALGLLSALNIFPSEKLENYIVLGELSLDGQIGFVAGVLPAAKNACEQQYGLICPAYCGAEAAWIDDDMPIIAASHLLDLVAHLRGDQILPRPEKSHMVMPTHPLDLADVKGQIQARRALEVAAAGQHNLLLIGPPGAGKSMLAQRLLSILPPLEKEEFLENLLISSIAGVFKNESVQTIGRPFRAPHHSTSMAALIGGGQKARPGEVSLAHNGVLFLDELPEFSPRVLDSLRQLLETGEILVSRANYHVTYPAQIQLIAAMNPCRCGLAGEPGNLCNKEPRCVQDYQARLSGPLLDRIDLKIHVPAVKPVDLLRETVVESSAVVAQRVMGARMWQKMRYQKLGLSIFNNGNCPGQYIEKIVNLNASGRSLLVDASQKMHFSARSFHRILKVARTLADLEQEENVGDRHIAEALAYRVEMCKNDLKKV